MIDWIDKMVALSPTMIFLDYGIDAGSIGRDLHQIIYDLTSKKEKWAESSVVYPINDDYWCSVNNQSLSVYNVHDDTLSYTLWRDHHYNCDPMGHGYECDPNQVLYYLPPSNRNQSVVRHTLETYTGLSTDVC